MSGPLHADYRAVRDVEDAKLFLLEKLNKHLELPQSQARILFADLSSAFNTMQHHILAQRLIKTFCLEKQDLESTIHKTRSCCRLNDSVLRSLLQGTQDGHGEGLDDFTEWRDESYLDLNANRAKEMIVDFRRQWRAHRAIQIHDKTVGIEIPQKYLEAIFQDILECDLNIEAITEKGHQRLPLLRETEIFYS